MTRLDVSFAVNTLCSFNHAPLHEHYRLALNVVSYLLTTKDLGITYGGRLRIPLGLPDYTPDFEKSNGLYCAHDSSFGTRPRPMGGYVIMYCNGAVDWSAKNLKIVPDNSNEAESAVGSRAAKALLYVRALNYFHGRHVTRGSPMLGDNKALYDQLQQEGASSRTRYYERAVLLLKRAVLLLILSPYLISTDNMIADIFTKATDKGLFNKMRNVMMNINSDLRSSLEIGMRAMTGNAQFLCKRLLKAL